MKEIPGRKSEGGSNPALLGLVHPGHVDPNAPFECFLPFIATQGLRPYTQESFVSLLRELLSQTPRRAWRPGQCHYAAEVAHQVDKLLKVHMPRV